MRVSEYCYDGTTLGWSIVNVLSTILRINNFLPVEIQWKFANIYIYIYRIHTDTWDVKKTFIYTYHRYGSKRWLSKYIVQFIVA